jgi:hypothetical protein
LKHGQYSWTNFDDNTFNLPERTREFYTNLISYIPHAKAWESIFKALDVTSKNDVVDLCPGWTPKIAFGLLYSEYKGRLLLLDTNLESMRSLSRFLLFFRPGFDVECRVFNLFENTPDFSTSFVTANHIVDDLILGLAAKREGVSLDRIYEEESVFTGLWTKIASDGDFYREKLTKLMIDFLRAILTKGGIAVLTQYASFIEMLLENHLATTFSVELAKRISIELCKSGEFIQLELPRSLTDSLKENVFTRGEIFVIKRL